MGPLVAHEASVHRGAIKCDVVAQAGLYNRDSLRRMIPSMAFARCGPTHGVVVHTAAAPSDGEWQAYLQEIERWFGTLVGCLVVTAGGGPSGAQRRALAEMFARQGPVVVRTAVMMDSVLGRVLAGVITRHRGRVGSRPRPSRNRCGSVVSSPT